MYNGDYEEGLEHIKDGIEGIASRHAGNGDSDSD